MSGEKKQDATRTRQKWRLTGRILLGAAVALCGAFFIYAEIYYHAENPQSVLAGTELVTVSKEKNGYFFDGPGEDTALIFYPGAKVEATAYGDLLLRLAEDGVDCFLIRMPFRMAFFDVKAADRVMEANAYENWYLAGHSLGGAMAANYAAKTKKNLDGLIFLGAYTVSDLSDKGFGVLAIYGSEDLLVNRKLLEKGRGLVPAGYYEVCIDGGNHAQYGTYGAQKKDGIATISGEEQRVETVREILEFIKER